REARQLRRRSRTDFVDGERTAHPRAAEKADGLFCDARPRSRAPAPGRIRTAQTGAASTGNESPDTCRDFARSQDAHSCPGRLPPVARSTAATHTGGFASVRWLWGAPADAARTGPLAG